MMMYRVGGLPCESGSILAKTLSGKIVFFGLSLRLSLAQIRPHSFAAHEVFSLSITDISLSWFRMWFSATYLALKVFNPPLHQLRLQLP